MTTPPEIPKSERSWLRNPAWASGFARLNNSRYRKPAIFAAIVLLGVPLLLRLVLAVPLLMTLALIAFVASCGCCFTRGPGIF